MEYVIGAMLGLAISSSAAAVGFDRDRSFYPTMLIVIATYYLLFALIVSAIEALVIEATFAAAFLLFALIGFRRSLWIVVAGLFAHGVFDLGHDLIVSNPGVPGWWPGFCLAVDFVLGLSLALLLWKGVRAAHARRP